MASPGPAKKLSVRILLLGEYQCNNRRLKTDVLHLLSGKEESANKNINISSPLVLDRVIDGLETELTFYDSSGFEEKEDLRKTLFPAVDAFVILYSVVDPTSYQSVGKVLID
jgi:hypothetical protein